MLEGLTFYLYDQLHCSPFKFILLSIKLSNLVDLASKLLETICLEVDSQTKISQNTQGKINILSHKLTNPTREILASVCTTI